MRILAIVLAFVLSACGGSGGGGTTSTSNNGLTQVTIGVQAGVAGGAIGVVPAIVQSIAVKAFNINGTLVAGTVTANRPNFNVTMSVPNGPGVTFVVLGFSGLGGTGKQVYEGVSAPHLLTGVPVNVAVSMNKSILITAAPASLTITSVATVALAGDVAGSPATAVDPLLWAVTGPALPAGAIPASLGVPGPNGASITFTPAKTAAGVYIAGNYTITAKINAAVNPLHNQAVFGKLVFPVLDPNAPVITVLGSNPVLVTAGSVYIDAGATAFDKVDGNVTALIQTINPVNTNVPPPYPVTYTVKYNVTDSNGNPAPQQTRTVKVIAIDTTPPVFKARNGLGAPPANITVPQVLVGSIQTCIDDVLAIDNVDGDITSSIVVTGTVNFAVAGVYPLTFNISDASGNAAAPFTRNVTVAADALAPVITLHGPANVNVVAGSVYTDAGATALDNSDGDITASIITTGLPLNTAVAVGTVVPVTYNVSDAAGNAATAVTRNVTVVAVDVTAPVITLKGAANVTVAAGLPYNDPGATAWDDVNGDVTASIVRTGLPANPAAVGVYTVTFNVSDAAGLQAAPLTRTVTVAADADGDGIPNVLEVLPANNPNVAEADHDGDGIFTLTELALGTDPLNALSKPTISALLGQTNSAGIALCDALVNSGRNGDTNPYGLSIPAGMDIDTVHNLLFVADSDNNRVLVYKLALGTNAIASRKAIFVLGQSDFEHNQADRGNTESPATVDNPTDVDYYSPSIASRWLVVSDSANNRVLIYNISNGINNGKPATSVLGQRSLYTAASGLSATAMNFPTAARVMTFGTQTYLVVADSGNNRTLLWNVTAGMGTLTKGRPADVVLGQANFTSRLPAVTAKRQNFPSGLTQWGNWLFVSDRNNNRVLAYNMGVNAVNLVNNMSATHALGQATLLSAAAPLPPTATSLSWPEGLAVQQGVNNYLFVADHNNLRVLAYDLNVLATGMPASYVYGQTTMVSGVPVVAATSLAQNKFGNTLGLAVGGNNLFVSDDWDDEIMTFDLTTLPAQIGAAAFGPLAINNIGQTNWVPGMADGTEVSVWNAGGSNDTGPTSLANPEDTAIGTVLGVTYLFVADELNDRVLAYQADAAGVPLDLKADFVFGQADFDHDGGNLTQWGMSKPRGVVFDSVSQMLFVSDTFHNRILGFNLALGLVNNAQAINPNDVMAASLLLGQPTFAPVNKLSPAATTATGLNLPYRLVIGNVGGARYLFATDRLNKRVLAYNLTTMFAAGVPTFAAPLLNPPASWVLGAPNFVTVNAPGVASLSQLVNPYGIDFDQATSRLFVADGDADRVLVWDLSAAAGGISNGKPAVFMLGQTDPTLALGNNPPVASQSQFDWAFDVVFDARRNVLWVSDNANSRILGFDMANLATGMNASYLIGQPNYVSKIGYLGDHNRTAYTMSAPTGLTVGPQGHLVLMDELDDRVLVIAP